jgi:hypothetical protein
MPEQSVFKADTGMPFLDRVLNGLLAGDNVVWQVETVDNYKPFVRSFVASALAGGRRLVYFRFARHPELVAEGSGAEIHALSPEAGFETFTPRIHKVIEESGRGACYVFDCLSDLAADWYSDLMLGNFFMVTCPYLYEMETFTYFALLRDGHSIDCVSSIRGTTQILIDVFRHDKRMYIHPLKVDRRHSTTMYLPHRWEGESFQPVTESAVLSEVLGDHDRRRTDAVPRTLDLWDRKFLQEKVPSDPAAARGDAAGTFLRDLRMMVTRDDRLIEMASRWLEPADLRAIRRRMIGTGLIGGKSVGMLLARAILSKADPAWDERLEKHDSFFIGSDVFYTFLVRNGCWHARREQRNPDSFLAGAAAARERVRRGTFPSFIVKQFVSMLEYFGQSPIIVRSSSLLEDSFGNAFTGKYESVFCPNQGSPQERLDAFLSAVREVYASTMSEEALLYRAHRGLIDRDEQMAILVQRVSGGLHGDCFYPQVAGVGLSDNPYVWSERIDPSAGVLRLVFGLGTRAVDRSDDDYTRLVALNAPLRRPDREGDRGAGGNFQRKMDLLDLSANRFATRPVEAVLRESPDLPIDLYASRRSALARGLDDAPRRVPEGWVLTFDRLLADTAFPDEMRRMLATLRDAYRYPVDTEFTANFLPDGRWKINLVQCRPLQVKEGGKIVDPPARIARKSLLLSTRGPVIGRSSLMRIGRVVFVDPAAYASIPVRERGSVARLVGRVLHAPGPSGPPAILLLGPGRWGTSTPSLGVPVSFAEIETASVICEIVGGELEVIPDVSLGTHFFNDLVESDILYMAVQPGSGKDVLNREFLEERRNLLPELLPDDAEWAGVVRVVDLPGSRDGKSLCLNADSFRQRAVCYLGVFPEGR